MLADYTPVPTLAVTDLTRARTFYEEVLGFTPKADVADGVYYNAGTGSFFLYPSAFAGTNKATAMSIGVPAEAFDAEVGTLRSSGVGFQTFDAEGVTWDDGVASFGDYRAVWFEDPDGNILNLETGMVT
ncbi:MAG: VOC family protein [Propionibacteriaceae bacterium]|nr:VOC family protein [Propionibacteriaceae bacterium]